MNNKIKFEHIKKQTLKEKTYKLHLINAKYWPNGWNSILDNINNNLNEEFDKHYKNQNNKSTDLLKTP
jgi:phage terminase Nu1 subunit (DNA packaging protein)